MRGSFDTLEQDMKWTGVFPAVTAPRLPLAGDERTMVERIVASTDAGLAALST